MSNLKTKMLSIFLILSTLSFSQPINKSILDYDSLNGSGEFVNAKGGTMGNANAKAFDEVKGKVYVSGDFGEDNYQDTIKTDSILKTKKFDGKVISDSPMYKAKSAYNKNTKELKFTLKRVKFTDGIIKDTGIALYLENNYNDSHNTQKNKFYNTLKSLSSIDQLNTQLNTTFGTYIFPTITKQTFDKISDLNITALDSVSYFDPSRSLGEIVINGNYGNTKTKVKNLNSNNDYKSSDTNMIFWIEKYTSANLKLGTVFSFSDSSTNMKDDDTYRDDYYGSAGAYVVYDSNSVIYTSIISVGGDYNHLNRYNDSQIGDFKNSSTNKNLFLGLNNSVYKEFDLKKSYITPKAELNIIGLNQGEINEGGDYGIDVDTTNSVSIQPGLGVEVGHGFNPTPNHNFSLSAGVMNYVEVGTPYNDLDASISSFGDNKLKIEKYNDDIVHSKISIKEGYQYLDRFGIYLNEDYTISKHQEQFEYGANIVYVF
jgi:hypothetical protein